MDKLSNVQVGQMMKLAAGSLRSLAEENQQLKEKVAAFEHRERVEKIASQMEEKSLNPELSYDEKVASLMRKDNLDAVEEAIGMSAPQTKLASIADSGSVVVEGSGSAAEDNFAASLAGID